MDEFVAITPVNFFPISWDCHFSKENLTASNFNKFAAPDLSDLCTEPKFADVSMGWSKEGLSLFVDVQKPMRRCSYPDVTRGDAFELFIDTRDVKTSGFNTRFCHHFFFLPEAVDEHRAGEITRFRTEDVHELCAADELQLKVQLKAHSYTLAIFIPAHCLYGYDPEQFDRLGVSYRISRPDGPAQHFSVVTEDYQVDQQPSLWSSVRLI